MIPFDYHHINTMFPINEIWHTTVLLMIYTAIFLFSYLIF